MSVQNATSPSGVPNEDITEKSGPIRSSWRNFFSSVYIEGFSIQQSGTTANRPTKNLWIGRRYYDTTLTKPVYVSSVSAGTATWKDAAGNTV